MEKNKRKQFLVAGLGMFGESVAHTFWEMEYDFIAVDADETIVQAFTDKHPGSVCYTLDASNEQALRQLDLKDVDSAVVCIGNMEANMMATWLLKNTFKVPRVEAKALNELHGQMLSKIGADNIVEAEKNMGERTALNLISSNVLDYLAFSKEISIMSVKLPKRFVGLDLIEANLRGKYNINIVAIKRHGKIIINPNPKEVFLGEDEIIVVGLRDSIEKFGGTW